MNGESLNITQDNLDKLQALFPDVFSEGKIDMEKFKATFSDEINFENERYVLNWAGKSDAFKVLQIPTTATLKPQPEQSINFDTTQNVFIEGENLEVLKVLQKSYYNKVKCIIIDPPYNTGSDSFIYPDSFKENKAEYEKRIGDKDEEGILMKEGLFRKNSKDSGHYHSNWLSMMYPRLFLAKNLLKDDGVIFVHIDDNEVHNLRLLMNEIFGEENFIAQMTNITGANQSGDGIRIQKNTEYCVVYSKQPDVMCINRVDKVNESYRNLNDAPTPLETREDMGYSVYYNESTKEIIPLMDYDKSKIHTNNAALVYTDNKELIKKGFVPIRPGIRNKKLHRWRWGLDTFKDRLNEIVVFRKDNQLSVEFLQKGFNPPKNYTNYGGGTPDLKELFDDEQIFNYPKSVKYIKYLASIGGVSDEIFLDFFAGSGTTAQAILELNAFDGGSRQFILVQLPELCDENSEAFKAGYKTIADISRDRLKRVVDKLTKSHSQMKIEVATLPKAASVGFKVFKLSPSNFKIWRGSEITEENLATQLDAFTNPVKEESKSSNMLYELMLKSGYLVTDNVVEEKNYYSVKDGELIVALEIIDQKIIDNIIAAKPKKVITLDNLFTGNDQLKTNTVLQMKDAGIDFKTI